MLWLWEIIYQKEKNEWEDPKSDGPTLFIQETGYQPNLKKRKEEESFWSAFFLVYCLFCFPLLLSYLADFCVVFSFKKYLYCFFNRSQYFICMLLPLRRESCSHARHAVLLVACKGWVVPLPIVNLQAIWTYNFDVSVHTSGSAETQTQFPHLIAQPITGLGIKCWKRYRFAFTCLPPRAEVSLAVKIHVMDL